MHFEILGEITSIEIIAIDSNIRIKHYLERACGKGRWRKLKGVATVQLTDGTICDAEIHWFESHHTGKKDLKIKRLLKWTNTFSASRILPTLPA